MSFDEKTLARFWVKVNKTDGCWLWVGNTHKTGYGQFSLEGKQRYAHRVSYEMANGKPPKGLDIDHKCHIRTCVNPAHLRAVTRKQNIENLSGPHSDGRSGFRGVSWSSEKRKWVAQVRHAGKSYYLGTFEDPAEAGAAAQEMRLKLYTHNDLDRKEAA